MKTKLTKFALVAALGLALSFALSCTETQNGSLTEKHFLKKQTGKNELTDQRGEQLVLALAILHSGEVISAELMPISLAKSLYGDLDNVIKDKGAAWKWKIIKSKDSMQVFIKNNDSMQVFRNYNDWKTVFEEK